VLETPYAGLMPFSEEQAPYFFGRDREREVIAANLVASRLTLFYGPSGVGKSSVLNAGVIRDLRLADRESVAFAGHPQFVIVSYRNWRDEPLIGLEKTIEHEMGALGQGNTFADRLQSLTEQKDVDILMILDQFEEYFMYHPNEEGDGTFAVEFARAVNRRGLRVNFLVSMREDSIAKLDFFKGRIPNLFDNYLRIARLTRDQAREAIVRPIDQFNRTEQASKAPFSIEPRLVDAVLDQVRATARDHDDAGKAQLQEQDLGVETPHLQLVMTRLWQEETAAKSTTLRFDTLQRLGGASEIVKRHVDSALDALTPTERDAAARVFQYLVTPAGTKIALGVEDLSPNAGMPPADLRALLVKLSSGESRILTSVAPAPDQPARERYQIFHDVLAGKVLDWRSRYVKAAEQQAAQALAAEERRRAEKEAAAAKRLRVLLALAVVLLVFATVATGYAIRKSRAAAAATLRADLAAAEAETANHTAEASRLDLLRVNSEKEAAEERATAADLQARSADLRADGKVAEAAKLKEDSAAAASRAQAAKDDAARYAAEQEKERKAAEYAREQAAKLQQQTQQYATPPSPPPVSANPAAAGGTNASTGAGGGTPPPNTAPTTGPAVATGSSGGDPGNTYGSSGDYREVYRKAIDAKNRKRWDEAAKLFQASLALRGTDTGERINISGFGNIEPYVPHYYLGLAQFNLKNCSAAVTNFNMSEKDGAIQKTKDLYASLQQTRAMCTKKD
jgi:hypothetical protein